MKVEKWTAGPSAKDFTPEELKLIDLEALQRHYLKITWCSTKDELTEDHYSAMRDITFLQNSLPMKYLKPVPDSFSYVAQKSHIVGQDKNVKNAGITCEPLNPDLNHIVSYTPINQALPLGTVVTLDVETEFESPTAERYFVWSDCLKTTADISEKIQGEKPLSKFIRPWAGKCHYCAIDIGSQITGKYEVSEVDTSIIKSFNLFGFARSDERREFVIWTYNAYNILPEEVLQLVVDHKDCSEAAAKIIGQVLEKAKGK